MKGGYEAVSKQRMCDVIMSGVLIVTCTAKCHAALSDSLTLMHAVWGAGVYIQVFITAPNPASGPIPGDVAGTFEGPYYEWFSTEKAQVRPAHMGQASATRLQGKGGLEASM